MIQATDAEVIASVLARGDVPGENLERVRSRPGEPYLVLRGIRR